jgi:hypothetical protein
MMMDITDALRILGNKSRIEQMLEKLPPEAKKWAESLPWNERRYVLSLCYLLCAATPEIQAEFLVDYDAKSIVQDYLSRFRIATNIDEKLLKKYIKQFYIHSAQDIRRQPSQYLESALRLVLSNQEKYDVLNYILGFEMLKMLFQMSWQQHERFYRLQIDQEDFYHSYIKPIQYTHRINGIITPKDEKVFFAKREYFVQIPQISSKKLVALIMATFSTEQVSELGFSVSRNLKHLHFEYDYIFDPDENEIFNPNMD